MNSRIYFSNNGKMSFEGNLIDTETWKSILFILVQIFASARLIDTAYQSSIKYRTMMYNATWNTKYTHIHKYYIHLFIYAYTLQNEMKKKEISLLLHCHPNSNSAIIGGWSKLF